MKIEVKSKNIEITFPSGRVFLITVYLNTGNVDWDVVDGGVIDDVPSIQTYADELARIADFVKNELNEDAFPKEGDKATFKKRTEPLPIIYDNEPTSEEDELKAVFFKLYDKMEEPERSEAKANWNYEFAKEELLKEPLNTVSDAILLGFDWDDVEGGYNKWSKLCYGKYGDK